MEEYKFTKEQAQKLLKWMGIDFHHALGVEKLNALIEEKSLTDEFEVKDEKVYKIITEAMLEGDKELQEKGYVVGDLLEIADETEATKPSSEESKKSPEVDPTPEPPKPEVSPAPKVEPKEVKSEMVSGKYEVLLNVKHDGVGYEKGSVVELDKRVAQILFDKGLVTPSA